MPHYIILLNWTDQGVRAVRDAPQRIAAARKAAEAAGGKWHGYYLTMGQYDGVTIVEAPSDEVLATTLLAIGSQGNVRTTTLKAFPEAEALKLINKIPKS